MIHEVAMLSVSPDDATAFEAAVASCAELFRAAPGCRSMRLERELERAGHYLLVVGWDHVDDHMVAFRGSPAFATWRERVQDFFTAAPVVFHVERAADHF